MDMLMALALSIGVLIAAWVKLGPMVFGSLGIAVPAGIVAWACFFAAGGKTTGLQKTIAANVSGVIWVWLAMTIIGMMNLGGLAFVFVGIVAFILVLQSKVSMLSFIPGAFCGAAITAASGVSDGRGYLMVASALIVGAILGYVSEMAGGMLAKKA